LNKENHIFDLILALAGIGVGIYSLLKPIEAYKLFQSKKFRNEEPSEQALKTTKRFSVFLILVSIGLIYYLF